MTLQIRLLGVFSIAVDGAPVELVTRMRVQELLACLLLHGGAPLSRTTLAAQFWPDISDHQALNNLRTLVARLRRSLPVADRYLHIDQHSIEWSLDPTCGVDLVDFEQARARGLAALGESDFANAAQAFAHAAELYSGDFLTGHDAEWIEVERNRLCSAWLDSLEKCALLMEHTGAHHHASDFAQRLLREDPLREVAYVCLMRSQLALGDRAGALRTYHACAALLREELGVDPGAETQAVYKDVLFADEMQGTTEHLSETHTRSESPTGGARLVESAPLVGRQQHLTWLQERWRRAASGAPHMVLVSGEAGIGKTRLANEMTAWVERHGGGESEVARCYAGGGAAYAPIAAWLRTPAGRQRARSVDAIWRTEAARLLPELLAEDSALALPPPISQPWQIHRFHRALVTALVGTGDRPLLLVIEDIHWADAETLAWIPTFLEDVQRTPLLLLATMRTEEGIENDALASLLMRLRTVGKLYESELAPLDREQTAAIAESLLGGRQEPAVTDHLYHETEGNPLFVVEMVRARYGAFAPVSATRETDREGMHLLPSPMHATLRYRLDQLSATARDLAECAAVLGREFRYDYLATASRMADDAVVRGLDELWRKRIVREQGADAYDFSHDKLRVVAYDDLSQARRRLLHHRAAEALIAVHGQSLDSFSGQIATHYELAGMSGEALPYYRQAAETAQHTYANAEAIRCYRRALHLLAEVGDREGSEAPALLERLGQIHMLTNQLEECRDALQQALTQTTPQDRVTRARLHRGIGNTWREGYHYPEALQEYAIAELELGAPPEEGEGSAHAWWQEWLQVMHEIDFVYYWLGRVEDSDKMRERITEPLARYGTPQQQAAFLNYRVSTELRRRRGIATPKMVADATTALEILQELGEHSSVPSARFMVGFITLWSGDPHGAREPIAGALASAEATGDLSLQTRCLAYLAIAQRECREGEQAERTAQRTLAMATEQNMLEYVGTAQAILSWTAWQTGKTSLARQRGLAALKAWDKLPVGHASTPFQWTALWPLIAIALENGKVARAMELVRILLQPEQQRLPDDLATLLEAAMLAWQENAPGRTLTLLTEARELAQKLRYL